MFSQRVPAVLTSNRLTEALESRLQSGGEVIDLTESNPTKAGFEYDGQKILKALSSGQSLLYEPDPRGLEVARRAIINYYNKHGVRLQVDQILLTASTSEAYALLFKLLCNPGDQILVPTPSYPLFGHLATVEAATVRSYRLYYDGDWHIDFNSLISALQPNTRAVVLVSPNNPTGSYLKKCELERLSQLCFEHNLAIICDEVFADYCYVEDHDRVATVAGNSGALTFALSGLSKVAALPQLKLGWIVTSGPDDLLKQALARLEFIADLFLSVATPVQHALEILLTESVRMQKQILDRVSYNRHSLQKWLQGTAASMLESRAGWYATIRVPRIASEEQMALELLEQGLLVHPGYFFDFEMDGLLVVSLIVEPLRFQKALERLVASVERWVA